MKQMLMTFTLHKLTTFEKLSCCYQVDHSDSQQMAYAEGIRASNSTEDKIFFRTKIIAITILRYFCKFVYLSALPFFRRIRFCVFLLLFDLKMHQNGRETGLFSVKFYTNYMCSSK